MGKQFIVTGMHRSATSLVAKGLREQGVWMGSEFLDANEGNPQGYHEDVEFVSLNEALLRSAGGSWNHPPSDKALFEHAIGLLPAIREVHARKREQGGDLYGAKDPRFCLTLPLHGQFLAADTHVVAVFRRPEFAARSLAERDGMTPEAAQELGREYNRRLLTALAYFTGVAQ